MLSIFYRRKKEGSLSLSIIVSSTQGGRFSPLTTPRYLAQQLTDGGCCCSAAVQAVFLMVL